MLEEEAFMATNSLLKNVDTIGKKLKRMAVVASAAGVILASIGQGCAPKEVQNMKEFKQLPPKMQEQVLTASKWSKREVYQSQIQKEIQLYNKLKGDIEKEIVEMNAFHEEAHRLLSVTNPEEWRLQMDDFQSRFRLAGDRFGIIATEMNGFVVITCTDLDDDFRILQDAYDAANQATVNK